MKKSLQSLVLLLMALMVPVSAAAAYEQLADGVYQDGTTLYITSGVTSLGPLQVNPSVIYSFAALPPVCDANTFIGYGATLHMPATSYGAYFIADYWCNFAYMNNDAVEPTGVILSESELEVIKGNTYSLTATITPSTASLRTVQWSSTDPSVASVNGGTLTALATGECDIIITCLGLQAACHVTVIETAVQITLDKHEARLLPNHSLTITPILDPPLETSLKVTVSKPEVAAARLMDGVVQVVGLTEGSTMIIVNSVDGQAVPDSCLVTVYTQQGDVNGDGYINISDVTALIDYLLSDDPEGDNLTNADCNNDDSINISDVTQLIDYLLSGLWPWEVGTIVVNGVTFKMVSVEGGTFMMGASDDDPDANNNEKPAHQVTLSSYSIGETEVTQELWVAVMGSNPSYFTPANDYSENLQRPVEQVSGNDCKLFISKLNQMTGKNFRLPTEAEWEYAARGGKKSQGYKYSGSHDIDAVAWYEVNANSVAGGSDNPDYGTHTVATKAPNELGLYDMSGNVREWCQDWGDSYFSEAQTNPTGPASGYNQVYRGGCWGDRAGRCRVSYRTWGTPASRYYGLGLRLAL